MFYLENVQPGDGKYLHRTATRLEAELAPMTFETLLVSTDGSRPAEVAAHRAFALAEPLGATVHLLSVADTRLTDHATARGGQTRVRERLRESAREQVSALEDAATTYHVSTVGTVREGVPARELVDYAEHNDVDCIVVGSYGRSGVERLAVGSVADAVVRTAPMPVMTVPSRPDDDVRQDAHIERLLVPTDGSDHAWEAARRGLDLAEALDASVHLLTVADTALERRFPNLFGDEAEQEREAALNERLEPLVTDARDRGLDATTTIRSGTPATEIVEYAREHDVDGIVMGTRGLGGVRRFLLGSVADSVVRSSSVPVVTVRTRENS